jgi:hypothetical protein
VWYSAGGFSRDRRQSGDCCKSEESVNTKPGAKANTIASVALIVVGSLLLWQGSINQKRHLSATTNKGGWGTSAGQCYGAGFFSLCAGAVGLSAIFVRRKR